MKKLTDAQQEAILEAGIAAFAAQGYHEASMAAIAREVGLSVGVLYKYYENKDALFDACLRHSLAALEALLQAVTAREKALLHYAREIIRGLQRFAREHGDHIRMYHRLTTASGARAEVLSREIEGMTARLYTDYITRGQQEGELREDMDPRCFAFFFDNLLMMLQFSYCCDYYRARLSLYLGEAAREDRMAEEELLKFLESAFTFEQSAISHREREKEGET